MSNVINLFDRKKELDAEKHDPTIFTHNNEGLLLPPGSTSSMSGHEKTHAPNSHIAGEAICLLCDYKTNVVTPVGAFPIECPSCMHKYMIYRLPPAPNEVWTCSCGCDQFYITRTSPWCICCGAQCTNWANS